MWPCPVRSSSEWLPAVCWLLCRATLAAEKEVAEQRGRNHADVSARLRECEAALQTLRTEHGSLKQQQVAAEAEHASAVDVLRQQLQEAQRLAAEARAAHETTSAAFASSKSTQARLQKEVERGEAMVQQLQASAVHDWSECMQPQHETWRWALQLVLASFYMAVR